MTPERWQQIRGVFDEAVAIRTEERAAYLDQASRATRSCAMRSSPCYRRTTGGHEVPEHSGGGFFKGGAAGCAQPRGTQDWGLQHPGGDWPGRDGRSLPRGPGRRSIRKGSGHQVSAGRLRYGVGARALPARATILASLDHPNIARLLDGGTTDEGIPYLAWS